MDTLGPVTLIQDAHVNMPYQSWEMSPCGMNKVLLIVKTVFMELQIYIKVRDAMARPQLGSVSPGRHVRCLWSCGSSSKQPTVCKSEAPACFRGHWVTGDGSVISDDCPG